MQATGGSDAEPGVRSGRGHLAASLRPRPASWVGPSLGPRDRQMPPDTHSPRAHGHQPCSWLPDPPWSCPHQVSHAPTGRWRRRRRTRPSPGVDHQGRVALRDLADHPLFAAPGVSDLEGPVGEATKPVRRTVNEMCREECGAKPLTRRLGGTKARWQTMSRTRKSVFASEEASAFQSEGQRRPGKGRWGVDRSDDPKAAIPNRAPERVGAVPAPEALTILPVRRRGSNESCKGPRSARAA